MSGLQPIQTPEWRQKRMAELLDTFRLHNDQHSMMKMVDGNLCINPNYRPAPTVAVAGRSCSYCRGLTLADRCQNCGAPQ